MSIKYNVSENGLRIDTFPKDILKIEQVIEYFGNLSNDNRINPGAVEIIHFKDVTDFKITYSESEIIAGSFQEPKSLLHIDATIFVCETDLAYGIGRMLKVLNEIKNPNSNIRVVRTESEIENFLEHI